MTETPRPAFERFDELARRLDVSSVMDPGLWDMLSSSLGRQLLHDGRDIDDWLAENRTQVIEVFSWLRRSYEESAAWVRLRDGQGRWPILLRARSMDELLSLARRDPNL